MRRHAGKIVRALVLLAILVALVEFARTVNWHETWLAIRSTSPGLLVAAALVNLLSLVLKGVRWWIFLRPIGVSSLWLAMRATFAGAGLNNILIANGGEAARVIFVARAAHVPSATVLATLALERLFELVGYVVLLALAVTFLSLPPSLERTRPFAIASVLIVIGLLVYLVKHPEKAELPTLEGESLLARAKTYGRRFLRTLTGISTGPRFAASLLISVVVWGLQVWTYQLTAEAAHFHLSTVGTVAAILAVNLGFAVRATPGNVGVFQMMYAVTAAAFGLDKDQATAVAFLIQAQQILPVTIIGLAAAPHLIFAKRRKTARPDNVLPGEPQPSDQSENVGSVG
ncbi:MAG TPA: lysylphosphatidylglycerol synthase transmembrane domain-containing protein [Gemmatimonadaceae bacterium]